MLRLFCISRKFVLACGLLIPVAAPIDNALARFSVLYSFKGGSDGSNPSAGLIRDSARNLYGTTEFGGGNGCNGDGCGTVFKLAPTGAETVLHSFTENDGAWPTASLIRDASGNLYGTTKDGGDYQAGVVFALAPNGDVTALYSFTGRADGYLPAAALIKHSGGLYGTTIAGGAYNEGTVFEVRPGNETVLYSFSTGGDGNNPNGELIEDNNGHFVGTTAFGGGTGCGGSGCGTIFEVGHFGGETILHYFTGYDGSYPTAGLIADAVGNLYGTASLGGGGYGTVFELTPDGTLTVLHEFESGKDGSFPSGGLIMDALGNLYGTTGQGGGSGCGGNGCGTVFKLNPNHQETILHSFNGSTDGLQPEASLIADKNGHLYGTTIFGGAHGYGTVFKLKE